MEIRLSATVERHLAAAFIEPGDFVDGLRQESFSEEAERPGVFTCRCTVALRRPLDLETAELRQLEVEARKSDEGWNVVAVRGLPVTDGS